MNEQMLDYVKAEKFDACIALGKNYLKDHPNSSINDEVHFWIGRAYREKFLAVQRHLYKKAYKAYKRKELAYWLRQNAIDSGRCPNDTRGKHPDFPHYPDLATPEMKSLLALSNTHYDQALKLDNAKRPPQPHPNIFRRLYENLINR